MADGGESNVADPAADSDPATNPGDDVADESRKEKDGFTTDGTVTGAMNSGATTIFYTSFFVSSIAAVVVSTAMYL